MNINKLTPDTVILAELGARLARLRKQRGYSQQKLATEAGLGVATLRRIESGDGSQLDSWLKLLKALNMEAPNCHATPRAASNGVMNTRDGGHAMLGATVIGSALMDADD